MSPPSLNTGSYNDIEGVTASRAITISAFDMPISSAISVIDGSLRFFLISVSRVVIAL